jgi:alkylresorcinol/alkylpyrone synthase
MGWDVKDDGFGIVLSPELPSLMRERLREALFPFLAREGLSLEDFDGFLLHPGGSKVLTTVESALGLSRDQLRYSWQVLKNYGNMSSATAMFVLKDALMDGARGRFLLVAFGPGFSGYFVVLDL